jgi:polar amino acid transport system substrate-binding protein
MAVSNLIIQLNIMIKRVRAFVLLSCLLSVWLVAAHAAPELAVRLATLEWPPYNGSALPDGGGNTMLVRQAFERAGYRVEVVTMTWMRAKESLNDPAFDGYFPVYLSPEVRRNCYLSERIGQSRLVLVERKASHFRVKNLDDLSHYLVGVVNGYHNKVEFDENVMSGKQQVDRADTDEANLAKLAEGRVDLIIIDENVMLWLLAHVPSLASVSSSVEALQPPLVDQGLYICFKRTVKGQQLSDDLTRGMKNIDIQASMKNYIYRLKP